MFVFMTLKRVHEIRVFDMFVPINSTKEKKPYTPKGPTNQTPLLTGKFRSSRKVAKNPNITNKP